MNNQLQTKLTPEEIHKLATAPLPTFNIVKSQYASAGSPVGMKNAPLAREYED